MSDEAVNQVNNMKNGSILVIGSGMAGMSAALEAAEAGCNVYLVEKDASAGGRVARMHRFFPKLCPPACGLELYFRRIRNNPRVQLLTLAEVEKVTGKRGDFTVTLKVRPRYVRESCTACGECVAVCPVEREDDFNYGMGKTKAIHLPHGMAMPMMYVIDDKVCPGTECSLCIPACRYDAIDLTMEPRSVELQVGSIVLATGWRPYDAAALENLGFGKYGNVISNVMMERLAAVDGPTGGRIVRPTDGQEVKSVAFIQCAGSRDENHLPYCSAVCCVASLKQATYVREQNPDARASLFFMDVRAPGRYETFYRRLQKDDGVEVLFGKVARIEEEPGTGDLIVEADSSQTGEKIRRSVNLVVLATGMMPTDGLSWANIARDTYGFVPGNGPGEGMHAAGVAKRPMDVASSVRDGTAAALKAIQDMAKD
jgi:quinone-modifying oxidoreductase subunit QmoA